MTFRLATGVCAVAILAVGMGVFAQAPPPAQGAAGAAATQRTAAEQEVTIAGCVQRETDYRRARDAGRGGVAGSGIGAGNEFVLVNASMSTGATASSSPAAGAPTGTAGAMAAYELTGANEKQAEQHVGKRVEISGKLKAADISATGRPTGGPTAGKPPEGVELTGKDLKLRELEVTSIREVAGTCPAP